jgi:predicted methyltransferase
MRARVLVGITRCLPFMLAGFALASVCAQAAAPAGPAAAIGASVADAARPAADRERDPARKPAECLAFAGVKPGDQVVELLPGGGYFTRLFSAAVGSAGRVLAVANPKSPSAAADAPEPAAAVRSIASDPHYANVSVAVQRMSQLNLPGQADLVWTSLNYHDLHNVADLDIVAFNQAVFAALKPGGIYVVVDHSAQAASGLRDTRTLHRIDAQAVRAEVQAAGFEFAGQSAVLENPSDPRTAPVFDPSIRGHTDQFMLKFRRPTAN